MDNRNEKGQLGLGDNTPHVGGPVKVPTIYTNAGKKSTNVKFVTGAVCEPSFVNGVVIPCMVLSSNQTTSAGESN